MTEMMNKYSSSIISRYQFLKTSVNQNGNYDDDYLNILIKTF